MLWTGKRVLITGGTRGIGLALAEALDEAGARIVVSGADPARLDRIGRLRPAWETALADLRTPAARERLATQVLSGGAVDGLINNAGVQVIADFRDGPAWGPLADEIEVNLTALVHLTTLLLPALLERPAAVLINVTSGLALVPKRSAPGYCGTKAGARAFTRALRYQLSGTPVRVIELLPPLVDTDMTRGRGKNKTTPREIARETLASVDAGSDEVRAGLTKLLFAIHHVSPWLAARLLRDS